MGERSEPWQRRERQEPVRVDFHLSGGQTRVIYERTPQGWIEIPTAAIPNHLRPLGSRFMLVFRVINSDTTDYPTFHELRAEWAVRVEELNDG